MEGFVAGRDLKATRMNGMRPSDINVQHQDNISIQMYAVSVDLMLIDTDEQSGGDRYVDVVAAAVVVAVVSFLCAGRPDQGIDEDDDASDGYLRRQSSLACYL